MSEIDERYQRGKIYTIRCYSDDTKKYIGSTIDTLSRRFAKHKSDSKINKNKILYKTVNGNWDDWYIELLQLWPCGSKAELEQQEGKHIREIGTLNKYIAGRTKNEYYIENKDILAVYKKQYNIDNKDIISEKQKQYNIDNKDIISEQQKQYRIENKDILNVKAKVKVICEYCNLSIRKSNIKQHLKTTKCLKAQNKVSD